jgi:site-specific recombinase XerD
MMVMLAKPYPTPLQVLGQPMISTTEKYAHVLPSDLHDAMQAVAL